ncbi:MAG TPA: cytosine permease [Ktedonobacterales bacterium]
MTMLSTDEPSSSKLDTGFETTGIERVEEHERAHTQLLDTMWLWWSANSVVATVAVGALSFYFGLGFWGSIGIIVLFNVLGALPVAFLSTLGPKTGLAQMPLSRFAFGIQGAKLPALFNAIACIGWSAVNALIGASLLESWSGGKISKVVALLILAVLTTIVSVFGYFIVHRYERIAWIPMFLLFGYVFYAASPHFNTNIPSSVTGLALFSSIMTFGGIVFGFAVGWTSYAADYTRRQPHSTPAGKVFTYALLGVTLPCIILEVLGVLLASTLGPKDSLPDAGTLISHNIGGGILASIVVLLLAFSTIANNVPNDYSFALSLQVLGVNIPRWILTLVGAVAYILIALLIAQGFNANLEGFLLLIAYWLGGYAAISFIEDRLRKGSYPVADYTDASKMPPGIAAVASMVIGLIAAAFGINQAATINFEGPLSKALADADIGFPLAIIVTGIVYYFLRKWEMSRTGR